MSANIVAFPTTVGRVIERLVVKPFVTWRNRQLALQELLGLDDHMLADIGITRSDIPAIAAGEALPRGAVNDNAPSAAA